MQGNKDESETYEGIRTASLIAKARIDISEGRLSGTEKDIGRQLAAYAARLQYCYKTMETDLKVCADAIERRQGYKENWEQRTIGAFAAAGIRRGHVLGVQENFAKGHIQLFDSEGSSIGLAKYEEGRDFSNYLREEVLPKLMAHLGMITTVGNRTVLNEEAQGILKALGELETRIFKLEQQATEAREMGEGEVDMDEVIEATRKGGYVSFLAALPNSRDGQQLKFLLSMMGTEVANQSEIELRNLIGIANERDFQVPMDRQARVIEIRLSKEGRPTVLAKDTYNPTDFGKCGTIHLTTKLEFDGEKTEPVKLEHSFHVRGWTLDPELGTICHVANLAGFDECRIRDGETPIAAEEHEVSAKTLSESQMMESPSVQYLQPLEGRDNFYIGIITPETVLRSSVDQAIKILGITPEKFRVPAQSHTAFVPPSAKITVDTNVGKLAEIEPFDLTFDEISISRYGNVSLRTASSEYGIASMKLAEALQLPPNPRGAHCVIGKIPTDLVQQLFQDPERYGFELRGDGLLYRKLERPLEEHVATSPDTLPLEQRLLQVQSQAPKSSPHEKAESSEAFRKRVAEVKAEGNRRLTDPEYKFQGVVGGLRQSQEVEFSVEQLRLALDGDPEIGRVPLVFSTLPKGIELWLQFKKEVEGVFKKHDIHDAQVQILGSGIHGYTRNPKKDFKPWRPDSDVDLAIFSRELAIRCLDQGCIPNPYIVLNDKYMVFKNQAPGDAMGFLDTDIGRDFFTLMEKWTILIYGEGSPPDHVDFKMNIGTQPIKQQFFGTFRKFLKPFLPNSFFYVHRFSI